MERAGARPVTGASAITDSASTVGPPTGSGAGPTSTAGTAHTGTAHTGPAGALRRALTALDRSAQLTSRSR